MLKNSLIVELAEKYHVTTGQIVLSWGVQRKTSVIPKSENENRLRKNITVRYRMPSMCNTHTTLTFSLLSKVVALEDADVKAIDELHKQPGLHRSLLPLLHSGNGVFGWTYEQLGWPFESNGIVRA